MATTARATTAIDGARRHPKTTSRCVAESETVTHDFEVAGYSRLKALGVGQFVSSGTFTAGGRDWAVRVYPKQQGDGVAVEYSPPLFYAGACLQLCDADAAGEEEVTARFTLSLLRRRSKGGGGVSPVSSRTMTAAFGSAPRDRHGFHKFVDASNLRQWRYDALTVRCVLTVVHAADPVPPPELAGDLGRLLARGTGADVTFDVGGRAFPAHRALLAARSPVFMAELFGGMMETDARRIRVEGVRPEVFGMLLCFIYTESLPGDGEGRDDAATVRRLLVAADRYGVERLKQICEGKLQASVDERTVASLLALAERHSCPRLRDACLAFMASLEAADLRLPHPDQGKKTFARNVT